MQRGSGHARRLPAQRPATRLPPQGSRSTGAAPPEVGGAPAAPGCRRPCPPLGRPLPCPGAPPGCLAGSKPRGAPGVWLGEEARLRPTPRKLFSGGRPLEHQTPARTWRSRGVRSTNTRRCVFSPCAQSTHTHSTVFSLGARAHTILYFQAGRIHPRHCVLTRFHH